METHKKPIIHNGELVGYRLYLPDGLFWTFRFIGYQWIDRSSSDLTTVTSIR